MKGRTASEAAAQEAFEEAGLFGSIAPRTIATYSCDKRLANAETRSVTVDVFVLETHGQHED